MISDSAASLHVGHVTASVAVGLVYLVERYSSLSHVATSAPPTAVSSSGMVMKGFKGGCASVDILLLLIRV